MLKSLISDPAFPKTELGRRATFWYYRLFEMIASLYKYEGLPDTVNRDYLETVLLGTGSIVWCKDKNGKLRALRGAHYGFDCYNFPTNFEIANPVLGNIKGTFGVDGVWMRNNIYAKPIDSIVKEYALNIAQLDIDLKVNLDNIKLTKVFKVDNDAQAKQVRELYKKIISGEPAVVQAGSLDFFSEENMNLFSSDVQYYGDKFLADRRTQINDFLTQFGINNISFEKKERLIETEVEKNNQEIEINKQYWLRPRKDALKEINRIFGTNITVDIYEGEKEEEVVDYVEE